MDTPGLVSTKEFKRYKLVNTFRNDPKVSLAKADIVGLVQDAGNIYTNAKINSNVLELLTEDIINQIPMILILNKVDKLKKKTLLLELVNNMIKNSKSLKFSDIFMVSALTGDGINDLRVNKLASVNN